MSKNDCFADIPQVACGMTERVMAEVAVEQDRPARITCFGLAFKPNIDDLRESPALGIATRLGEIYPGKLATVEPFIESLPSALAENATLVLLSDGLAQADVAVMPVDHDAFRATPIPASNEVRVRSIPAACGRVTPAQVHAADMECGS